MEGQCGGPSIRPPNVPTRKRRNESAPGYTTRSLAPPHVEERRDRFHGVQVRLCGCERGWTRPTTPWGTTAPKEELFTLAHFVTAVNSPPGAWWGEIEEMSTVTAPSTSLGTCARRGDGLNRPSGSFPAPDPPPPPSSAPNIAVQRFETR